MQTCVKLHVRPSHTVVGRRHWQACICAKAGAVTDEDRRNLKDSLKKAVAVTKRGKTASPEQQTEILRRVEELEAANPTKDPAFSDLLSGDWSLLYNGPGVEGDITWERRTGGVEGPFLAALRPFTANLVSSRGILQVIDTRGGSVQNIADFRIANAVNGRLNVAGTVAPIEHEGDSAGVSRVDVGFTSFSLKIGVLPKLWIPLTWPKTPKGWVDTTFLDKDFRIGRGDKGSVFVTARKK